jgi:AraC-like DNA-binding protein
LTAGGAQRSLHAVMGVAQDVAPPVPPASVPEVTEQLISFPGHAGGTARSGAGGYPLVRRYGAYRRPLRFLASAVSDRCHTYCVSPDMLMAVVDVGCRGTFESTISGQDIVEFHYRLAGSIALAGSWGEVQLEDPACLLWYQAAGCDDVAERMGPAQLTRVTPQRESWISLYCDRRWLARIGGSGVMSILGELPQKATGWAAPVFRVSSPDGQTIRLAREILAIEGSSPIDCLLATAKAHEMLAMTLSRARFAAAGQRSSRRADSSERRAATLAREILNRELLRPPSVPELARRVGVNRFRLGAVFKQEFGEQVADFVRRQRLELSAELVRGSTLQVREIALRVGYQHHSTFTAAFKRHFGATPKRVRRSARLRH